MRQATLSSELQDLFALDANRRVSIEVIADTNVDNPGWTRVAVGVEVQLLAAGVRDRQNGMSMEYQHPVTHVAFCEPGDDIQIGRRIVETHMRRERGDWVVLRTAPGTYLIMSIEHVPGAPEPRKQVRMDLWQMSVTTGE